MVSGALQSKTVHVERLEAYLGPNSRRVLLRPFGSRDLAQANNILSRVLALKEADVPGVLQTVLAEFEGRHHMIRDLLLARFDQIRTLLPSDQDLSEERRLLVAACFVAEYSLESAALFNPSIVPHPDQSNLATGELRVILSLRATGEGHISSITFRTGTLRADGRIHIDTPTPYVAEPLPTPNPIYERELFGRKLHELGLGNAFSRRVLGQLDERFTLSELRHRMERERWKGRNLIDDSEDDPAMAAKIMALATSNYDVAFRADRPLSERIIFPYTPSQSNGIEDARFVRFEDAGEVMYYATYTAYDGRLILPQMMETADFVTFHFSTLNGPAVQNKGMALFPRKINGLYTMLGRQDGQSITIMFSDHVHFWYEHEVLVRPRYPWELVQMGNCGSPVETEAGWLVLSHGVGPMRKYCIGAFLLDKDDPRKVLGRLSEPLLTPDNEEREGYVPNVVYTCGYIVHNGRLIIPYAMSDYATKFATCDLKELLGAMV